MNEYITPIQHKYAVGDRVRANDGAEGEIAALMPYTFIAPAYYVRIGGSRGSIVAMSERSLEKIESQGSETV